MTGFMLLARLLVSTMLIGSAMAAEPDLRQKLEAQYAAIEAAMAAHDPDAISALLTSDFVSVDSSNQSEDAAKMIEGVVALPQDPNRKSHTTLTKITGTGDIAFVEQRYDMTTTKIGRDGQKQDITMTALSTDTWINSNGVWRLNRTVTNQIDYAVNGQLVVHKVRPN